MHHEEEKIKKIVKYIAMRCIEQKGEERKEDPASEAWEMGCIQRYAKLEEKRMQLPSLFLICLLVYSFV